MDSRYNVYFAGEVLAGHDPARVRQAVGQLFKANEATLDKLFNGRTHMVKRGCDKATALKYKQAMEKAGARPVIKAADPADVPPPATGQPQAAPAPQSTPAPREKPAPAAAEKTMTAAERIAALAAAPDVGSQAQPAPAAQSAEVDENGVSLAPPQSDVLRPEERTPLVERDVDTGDLAVDEAATRLAEPTPPPPAAPDVTHLSMGEAGEAIPTLPSQAVPLNPNTDAIDLAPEGTDFSDCAAEDAPEPMLDLSAMVLAPEGSDVLAEEFRREETASAPDTAHIALED